jgi:hypothetical protein
MCVWAVKIRIEPSSIHLVYHSCEEYVRDTLAIAKESHRVLRAFE